MKNKHVKRTNRTLKKISVASILVGLLTAVIAPSAIAAADGPQLVALTADTPIMSNRDVQSITTIWDATVYDLAEDDIVLSGTAMNCIVDPFMPMGDVIQFTISGCTDGILGISIKPNAVFDLSGQWGPSSATASLHISISRQPSNYFLSTPVIGLDSFEIHVQAPNGLSFFNPLSVSFSDPFCRIGSTSFSSTDVALTVVACGQAPLVVNLWPYSLNDLYGNSGPSQLVTSAQVSLAPLVSNASPSVTPTPTPTPTPDSTPALVPVPASSPSTHAEPTPVIVVVVPIEPTPEATPTPTSTPTPTPALEPEPTAVPTLEPRITPGETHSNQQQLIAVPETSVGPPSGGVKQIVVHPVRLSEVGRAFDWSPVANGLIAMSIAIAATAGVVALRRLRVRRLAIG
ncbi:MAG: hypothetical protein RLZZ164_25 [Actinomycetota bacterium]|jgi:hypothetical protein